MNEIITEKNYPVENIWILKSIVSSFILLVLLGLFFLFDTNIRHVFYFYAISIVIFAIFYVIYAALRKSTFHYSIDVKFLSLQQGILNKQQRHIPYGVIQNIFVKQDLFDRLFGLASLILENASMGAGSQQNEQVKAFGITFNSRKQGTELIGSKGNMVSIPGLSKRNAEALKGIILQKMKENPIEDGQSGL